MYQIVSVCRGGGYRYCRTVPAHPRANAKGLYPLHRVVAENKLGRHLCEGEEIHHIDGDKSNNSPDNLAVLTKSEHARVHHPPAQPLTSRCDWCGSSFEIAPHVKRLRSGRNRNGRVFCSRSCAGSGARQ